MVVNRPLHVHELVGNVGCLQGSDLEHNGVQREHRLGGQGHQAIADASQHDVHVRTVLEKGKNSERLMIYFCIPLILQLPILIFCLRLIFLHTSDIGTRRNSTGEDL